MSWVAVGVGAATLIAGGIKAISANNKAKRAERAIENLETPTYKPNQSITDYYNEAIKRYQNAYQGEQYRYGIQQGDRSLAAGVGALQDRRSAVGGISRLVALTNDNALRQGLAAQDIGQLGAAAQVKAQDDRFAYNANEVMPYQKKLQLYGMKAGAARTMEAAGWQDIGSGINTIGSGVSSGVNNGWGGDGGSNNSMGTSNWTNPNNGFNYQDPSLYQTPMGGRRNDIFNYYDNTYG